MQNTDFIELHKRNLVPVTADAKNIPHFLEVAALHKYLNVCSTFSLVGHWAKFYNCRAMVLQPTL